MNFLTPVHYGNRPKSLVASLSEIADGYFNLGQQTAYAMKERSKDGRVKVFFAPSNSSLLIRAGKFVSYFTIVIPIFMLIAKAALRSTHTFKVIDLKQKLAKGIDVSDEVKAELRILFPTILKDEDSPDLQWIVKGGGGNSIFSLTKLPGIVFKTRRSWSFGENNKRLTPVEAINKRYDNMITAKQACLKNDLDLLIVPQAQKFDVEFNGEVYSIIAEQKLNLAFHETAQEELYHQSSARLNETARQLAILVANTGFYDVTWRNIPILNEPGSDKPRIGLIDLEHINMRARKEGFLGNLFSRGLIRSVSEEQINIVVEEARKQGVQLSKDEVVKVKQTRLEELEEDQRRRILYARNGIITGKEPIVVNDLKTLGLVDLTKETEISVGLTEPNAEGWSKNIWEPISLEILAKYLIAEVNRLILESSDQLSPRGMRSVVLNTSKDPLRYYYKLGLRTPTVEHPQNYEDQQQRWPHRILQALVDKGYILNFWVDIHGYHVQA